MKKQELSDDKFIFPRGVWECFVCQKPKINMFTIPMSDGVYLEDSETVALICIPCRIDVERAQTELSSFLN